MVARAIMLSLFVPISVHSDVIVAVFLGDKFGVPVDDACRTPKAFNQIILAENGSSQTNL
jgi:hypothetical protein